MKTKAVTRAHTSDSAKASATGAEEKVGWMPGGRRGSSRRLAAVSTAMKIQNAKIPSSSPRVRRRRRAGASWAAVVPEAFACVGFVAMGTALSMRARECARTPER